MRVNRQPSRVGKLFALGDVDAETCSGENEPKIVAIMKLHSEQSFWRLKNGLLNSYPMLQSDVTADVVIIGAGITGSLIADRLVREGIKVVILDGRDVASGSTSASTALLQYEMDTSLKQLCDWCGPVAGDLYRQQLNACTSIKTLCEELEVETGFRQCHSCYLAATDTDADELRDETALRQEQNIPAEFWDEATVRQHFDFNAAAAIWSGGAAQVDPYQLTHALLHRVRSRGGAIFDRSPVTEFHSDEHGVTFRTEHGSASGRRAIIAAGYESQFFLPRPVAQLHSTFAFASEPLKAFPGWPDECLIWETARPYLYLRTTPDRRLIAGGADIPFRNEQLRDAIRPKRIAEIERRVRTMFPRIPFVVDYSWAGTFGETADGLPFIGEHPDRPGLMFALCYGGNGITFSVLAAEIIGDDVQGKTHPLSSAVGFDRPSLKKATKDNTFAFLAWS